MRFCVFPVFLTFSSPPLSVRKTRCKLHLCQKVNNEAKTNFSLSKKVSAGFTLRLMLLKVFEIREKMSSFCDMRTDKMFLIAMQVSDFCVLQATLLLYIHLSRIYFTFAVSSTSHPPPPYCISGKAILVSFEVIKVVKCDNLGNFFFTWKMRAFQWLHFPLNLRSSQYAALEKSLV